jgi:type IV secretory pathway VirB4 component
VLIEGNGRRYRLDFKEERRLWDGIECMYVREPEQCTVSNFGNIVGELNERLHRWTRGGQYGFLFDNAEDTLSFSHFQTFNFAGWGHAPDVLEPLDFPLPSSRMSVWATSPLCRLRKYGVLLSVSSTVDTGRLLSR